MGIGHKLSNVFVNKLDAFGLPVGLYYRGQEEYRTTFGACCTVLLAGILIGLTVLGVLSMNWA